MAKKPTGPVTPPPHRQVSVVEGSQYDDTIRVSDTNGSASRFTRAAASRRRLPTAQPTVDDDIRTGNGQDNIRAGGGNDFISGGNGVDTIFGEAGNDTIWGDAKDALDTGNGADILDGGSGDDVIYGGNGADQI